MTPEMALDLAYMVMITAAKVAAPFMIAAVCTGVLVNVIQTVTQIKDMSLTFIPKLAISAIVMGFSMPWIINVLVGFFTYIFQLFPQMVA
jgi:flagellar biosynthetic protein FliQ